MFSLARAYLRYDPAAKSLIEVLFLYPGIKATCLHRIAHVLYQAKQNFLARMVAEFSRFLTGIEIHPGAQIGKNVIFDHGHGIVIGETAIVLDEVVIYQGVTLGGTDTAKTKRHPTIECRVIIGTGAKVLGNIIVGSDSRIGANSVVIDNVPPGSTVVGIPGKIIKRAVEKGKELCHNEIMGGFDASI